MMTADHIAVTPYYETPQTAAQQIATLPELKYKQTNTGEVKVVVLGPDAGMRTFTARLDGTYKGKTDPARCVRHQHHGATGWPVARKSSTRSRRCSLRWPPRSGLASGRAGDDALRSRSEKRPSGSLRARKVELSSSVFLRRSSDLILAAASCTPLIFAAAIAHADVKTCQALEQRLRADQTRRDNARGQRRTIFRRRQGLHRIGPAAARGRRLAAGARPPRRHAAQPRGQIRRSRDRRSVLADGAAINARDLDGSTALYLAAEAGNRRSRGSCGTAPTSICRAQRHHTDCCRGIHGQRHTRPLCSTRAPIRMSPMAPARRRSAMPPAAAFPPSCGSCSIAASTPMPATATISPR